MKRILSLLMVLAVAAFSFSTLALSEKDIPAGAWYTPYAQRMVREVNCDSFIPDREMSKEEFVSRTVQLLLPGTGDPMAEALSCGLINEPEFPRDSWGKPITRQEMVRVAVRAAEAILHEEKATYIESFTSKITDWVTTCDFCKPYAAQAYAKGLICGLPDGSFQGTRNVTCAEAVVVLTRLLDPSYRIQYVSDVAFNEKTDVTADGRMKLEKAKEFMLLMLDNLSFYQDGGKYYVKGRFPELPSEFSPVLLVNVAFNDNTPKAVYTTHTGNEGISLPLTGEFVREITGMTSPAQVYFVVINTAINAPDAECEATNEYFKYNGILVADTLNLKDNVRIFDLINGTHDTITHEISKLFRWENVG